MRILYLMLGIVIGGLTAYLLLKKQNPAGATTIAKGVKEAEGENWKWPDSLDALIAAPGNHELVFENEQLRVLKVTVVPGILDPIHTHRGKSIIWVTKTSPILYHVYDHDSAKKLLQVRTDTITVKEDELFKGAWENPEPPHAVENIGKDTFQLYRIEYKTKM